MKGYRLNLMLCCGTGCVSMGAFQIKDQIEKELVKRKLDKEIRVIPTGCNGFCERGPILVVQPDGIFYGGLNKENIPHLVEEHFLKGRPVKKLMYTPTEEKIPVPKLMDIGFFNKQVLIALRDRGVIDPEDIEDYIARDGYSGLAKAVAQMRPDEIVEEIKLSGLRGRGGAGFPTGVKWEAVRKASAEPKYLIANCDEGDPGAFMDRNLVEANPHAILEGMMIAARGVGAKEGYIYIRNEYPLAVQRISIAIDQAKKNGLLGDNILDTGFNFDIKVVRGAGAFVCGEETALIASVEGRLGEPRPRPPYPAEKGLWDQPTCINNVETLATVPHIINRGAKWFSSFGTETSKGTKIFSLVGKVKNTGLIEVPMGITIGEIIYDIGGGLIGDRRFKAVQTGGPSGGCIPAHLLNLPIDYESLADAGSMMGSGGMVVMDETTCMVDIARYFLSFTKDESCGKCTPCREGIPRMFEILTRITKGKGTMEDIDLLESLGKSIKNSALCGLGNTAPNPVLTTLKYFRDEYEAHIVEKKCPAAVCQELSLPPCMETCPIDTQAPAYIAYVAQGMFREAFNVITEDNPLSITCGKICSHMCEVRCRCGESGEPISIRNIKRFVLDYGFSQGWKLPVSRAPKKMDKVAIVGAGPAGLMCGWELAKLGYRPTIFEAEKMAGGMLTLTIPEFRLPKADVEREIEAIKQSGVEIKTGMRVGTDISLEKILSEGYKAVFLAMGAHKNIKLGIPGEDAEGVLDPIEFLKTVKRGEQAKIGKKVAVIGGGNTAIDVARTAVRLGSDVTIIYRRTRDEMPANIEEILEAMEEGIKIEFLATPVEVISESGVITGLKCTKMSLGEFGYDARRKPIPQEGSEFLVQIDTLIPAIGQEPEVDLIKDGYGIELSKWNTIVVDAKTMRTSVENIFAGGDVVTGPWVVIEAMGSGKRAAQSIHRYLQGFKDEKEWKPEVKPVYVKPLELSDDELEKIIDAQRPRLKLMDAEERKLSFEEVSSGLNKDLAMQEAKRCVRCDLERIKEEVVA